MVTHKKIYHIHIDKKFTHAIGAFINNNYSNTNIYIGDDPPSVTNSNIYKSTIKDCNRIITLLNKSADLVVFWGLDYKSSYIINRVNPNLKIMWRFFGFELYSKIGDNVYSENTLKYRKSKLKAITPKKLFNRFKIKIEWYKIDFKSEFIKSIHRSNYFMGVSKNEYQFLLTRFPKLPPFIQYSFHTLALPVEEELIKKNKIIIGNSRARYNNHLDIIYSILQLPIDIKQKYTYIFFLNYGPKTYYSNKVEELGAELPNSEILTDFIPKAEFEKFYEETATLVINSYRQHAIGNIFIAMKYHLKIYLNPNNITYDWLLQEGFSIFSTQDLKNDLENNKIFLSQEDKENNIKTLKNFKVKYSKENFQAVLSQIL